jgi:hypothetical protein
MQELIICPVVGGGNAVVVRDRSPAAGETVYLNRKDKRRAYVNVRTVSGLPDTINIGRAIAELRGLWGPLPVRDHSGACGHLTA